MRLVLPSGSGTGKDMTPHAFTSHEIPSTTVRLMRKIAYCNNF